MKIRGKEVKFLRTVKATCQLEQECPDQNLDNLPKWLSEGTLSEQMKAGATMIHLLNEGYEENKKIEDPDYEPVVLSVEDIMRMDFTTFNNLLAEAYHNLMNGAQTTVETQKSKKKVKNQE